MLGIEIPNAKILITVKTYPMPTPGYEEIVCTAGLTEEGDWIRIYPVPYRDLPFNQQYKKYDWILLNLTKNKKDFRKESYSPKKMFDEKIDILDSISTKDGWKERKKIILKNIYYSFDEIIALSKTEKVSLGTIKPQKIINFEIESTGRHWPEKYSQRMEQYKLFENVNNRRSLIRKLPYKYYYRFTTLDGKERKLQIFDWEIGALFWNCMEIHKHDEDKANEIVKKKYFEEFSTKKDLYFFVGTTYRFHKKGVENPFSIIGVFYPPLERQLSL
jgi:hypothetical protein